MQRTSTCFFGLCKEAAQRKICRKLHIGMCNPPCNLLHNLVCRCYNNKVVTTMHPPSTPQCVTLLLLGHSVTNALRHFNHCHMYLIFALSAEHVENLYSILSNTLMSSESFVCFIFLINTLRVLHCSKTQRRKLALH